ncbi:hypothetical protein HanXRQr2_Chr09g0369021 [Helianthus annuus]|uniref:Uncharacterized protein n=1 Tax=Helianthus annuus TaxID=4232 RepID=A0A251TTE3_HELAN|nr:hypothetical protein HanXRQr2_Chr09g0369021 [Helianthus annuus]
MVCCLSWNMWIEFALLQPFHFFHVILHDSITHSIQFFSMTFKFHHEQHLCIPPV